jgi:hypothetical protein
MVRADASPWPRAQCRHVTTADVEAGVVGAASLLVRRLPSLRPRSRVVTLRGLRSLTHRGAVLSSDDFGSSVKRDGGGHRVYGDESEGAHGPRVDDDRIAVMEHYF